MAKRVILCIPMGRRKAGSGIEVDDHTAALWASKGWAKLGDENTPLKKGNLDAYQGCTPVTAGEKATIAANKQTQTHKE